MASKRRKATLQLKVYSICQHLSHLKNLPLRKLASPRKRKQDITHKANLLNLTHFEISNFYITKSLV